MAEIIDMNTKKKVKITPSSTAYTKIEQLLDIELYYLRGLADIELRYSKPNNELLESYCDMTCRINDLKQKIADIL
jgi:hypothetical protein